MATPRVSSAGEIYQCFDDGIICELENGTCTYCCWNPELEQFVPSED